MWLFCLIVDVGLSVICLTFSDYGHICLTIVTVLGMPTICLKVGAKSDEFRAPEPETTNCLTIERKSDKKRRGGGLFIVDCTNHNIQRTIR
jgi:hypothetical protein